MQTDLAKKIFREHGQNPTPLMDGTEAFLDEMSVLNQAEHDAARLLALETVSVRDLLAEVKTDRQRMVMLRYLIKLPDDSEQALAFLREMLARHNAYFIYDSAAEALGRIRTPAAREILETAQQRYTDPDVRAAIMKRLAQFEYAEVPDYLAEYLNSDDYHHRQDALETLASIPGTKATDLLLTALDHADKSVRDTALEILRERDDPAISRELGLRLEHASAKAKPDLVKTLGKRGDAVAVPVLLKQLETSGSKALHRLILLALGDLHNPLALPALHQVMTENANPEHVNAACIAVGRIASHESIPHLTNLLLQRSFGDGELNDFMGNNLYLSAANALKRIKHAEVCQAALTILNTLDKPVKGLKAMTRLELVRTLAGLLGQGKREAQANLVALEPHLTPDFEEISDKSPYVGKYHKSIRQIVNRLRKQLGMPALSTATPDQATEATEEELLQYFANYNPEAVVKMGARAIPALRRIMSVQKYDSEPRKPPVYIAGLLQQMGCQPDGLREQVLFALANNDSTAVASLGSGTARELAALFPHIVDDRMKQRVLLLLAELDTPELAYTLQAIKAEPAGALRYSAAEPAIRDLLAQVADQQLKYLPLYLANWNCQDDRERQLARLLLPYMSAQIDLDPFIQYLQANPHASREAEFICKLLGKAGNKQAIPALADYLVKGSHPDCAVSALRNIGGKEAILALKPGLRLAKGDSRYARVPEALRELGYQPSGKAEEITTVITGNDVKKFRRLLRSDPERVAETVTTLPRSRFMVELIIECASPCLIPLRVSAFLAPSYHDFRKKDDPLQQQLLSDDPAAVLQAFKQQCEPLDDGGPFHNTDQERAIYIVSQMVQQEAVAFSLELLKHAALPWVPGTFKHPAGDDALKLALDHLGKHKCREGIEAAMTCLTRRNETGLLRAILSYLWRVRAVEVLANLKTTDLETENASVRKTFDDVIHKLEKCKPTYSGE